MRGVKVTVAHAPWSLGKLRGAALCVLLINWPHDPLAMHLALLLAMLQSAATDAAGLATASELTPD